MSVTNIPLSTDAEAAYAAYSTTSSQLVRAIVINMNTYNTTVDGTGLGVATNITERVSREYTFDVGGGNLQPGDRVAVQRLSANGSDAISGISWDGWSYNYELDMGRPVRLSNVTTGEYVTVSVNGTIVVSVPDSSAAVLNFVGNGTTVSSNGFSTSSPLGGAKMESGAQRSIARPWSAFGMVLSWALW